MRLRRITYMIREHQAVPGCAGCDRLGHTAKVPVAGYTSDAMGLFAVRYARRPWEPRGWKVDHRPSGHLVVRCATKAEAIVEALRYAGATVDGQPVDWSLSPAKLRAMRPRMVFPDVHTEAS